MSETVFTSQGTQTDLGVAKDQPLRQPISQSHSALRGHKRATLQQIAQLRIGPHHQYMHPGSVLTFSQPTKAIRHHDTWQISRTQSSAQRRRRIHATRPRRSTYEVWVRLLHRTRPINPKNVRTSHLTWPCLSYVNLRQFKRKLIRLVSNPRRTVAMLVTADIRNVLERTSSSSL